MTEESSERLERIVELALELDPAERGAFLAKACAEESLLRDQLDSLVSAHEDALATATHATRAADDESPTQIRSDTDASERAVSETPGHCIGPYRILRQIGRGGMGVRKRGGKAAGVEGFVAAVTIKVL